MSDQLEELPSKKADLEETQRLLERLEARKDRVDPDRYERLRARYEEKIERLEPTVEELTEQGETRKLELEDRLAHQRSRAREAEAELEEVETLHEEGAIGEEAYREDRRRLRRQKKDAEKQASQIEGELDEVRFYLREKGDVSYRKEKIRGQAEAVADTVRGTVTGLLSRIRGILSRAGGRVSAGGGIGRYLPSWKTVAGVLLAGAALFALNWLLGLYIADRVKPILQSRVSELQRKGDVRIRYQDVGVNPLFRTLSIQNGRVEPSPENNALGSPENSVLTWRESTLELSFRTVWKLSKGERLDTLRNVGFTVEEARFTSDAGQVHVQHFGADFEGLVNRRLFEEERPRAFLQHPQSASLRLTGLSLGVNDKLIGATELLTHNAVRRLSRTDEAQISISFEPAQRAVRVQCSVEKPKSSMEASGKLEYGFDQYDNFQPRRLRVDGGMSVREIPYQFPDGPQMEVERFEVHTETPVVISFEDEPPFPEGRITAELKQRATGGRFERRVQEKLQEVGIQPSSLREGMTAHLDYEYDGNIVHIRQSSLSTGIGSVQVDGKMQVRENRGQFQNMKLRFQNLPSEVQQQIRRRLERYLDQRIPRNGGNLGFRLTGSVENPTIRSLP